MTAPVPAQTSGTLFPGTSGLPGEFAVATPSWRLSVAGRDVTREITPMVTSVAYTDHLHGKSDDIELVVENREGRWTDAWYPTKGDVVELLIGYAREPLLPCGRFQIDKIEASGPPDIMTIRGLAAGIIPAFRTKRSAAYEGQQLREIAEQVAARHALTVTGDIADVRIARATQHAESDLSFLSTLAARYGHVFNVRGALMVFYQVETLERAAAVVTINRVDVGRYSLADQTRGTYRDCIISYDDPASKKPIKERVSADGITSGDTLRIDGERVESRADALTQARAALHAANRGEAKGRLETAGSTRLVSGNTIKAVGFEKLSGNYLIETARHTLTRSEGYRSDVEVARAS